MWSRSIFVVAASSLFATIAPRPGISQPAQPTSGDVGLGPVRCYLAASRTTSLESSRAVSLCLGGVDEMPVRCFQAARNALFSLTDAQAVRLCQAATSTEPAMCAARLKDTTSLTERTIAGYCAALQGEAIVPARGPGSPACIQNALDRTSLSDEQAARLCRGSSSVSPVACFELADDETTLSTGEAIELCAASDFVYGWWPPGV